MAIEQIYTKIHEQLNALKQTQAFSDANIQPSVNDAQDLLSQLQSLSELLVVYNYLKQNKELSPDFDLHLKVMEKAQEVAQQAEPIVEVPTVVEELPKQEQNIEIPTVVEDVPKEAVVAATSVVEVKIPTTKKIEVSINDKFRMINELFKQNGTEYTIAIEQLNVTESLEATDIYLKELSALYNWDSEHPMVKLLYTLAKKRFS